MNYTAKGPSLYEQVGGSQVINKAVDYAYGRIFQHPRLFHFFKPLDIKSQSAHQKAYIAHILGGFPGYRSNNMMDTTKVFEDMPLTQEDVEDLNQIIEDAMIHVGIDGYLIEQIMGLLRTTKDEIIKDKYGLF